MGYSSRSRTFSRLAQHFRGEGSFWTRLHPPCQVLHVDLEGRLEDEDSLTLQMMDRYGFENVRGGAWCRVCLDQHPGKPPAVCKTVNKPVRKSTHTVNPPGTALKVSKPGCWPCQRICRPRLIHRPHTKQLDEAYKQYVQALGLCPRCGQSGHVVQACNSMQDVRGLALSIT